MTPEAINTAIKESIISGQGEGAFIFQEIFKEGSIVRDMIRLDPDGFGAFIKGQEDVFLSNPFEILTIRTARNIRSVTNAEFLDNVTKDFGVMVKGKKAHNLKDRKLVKSFLRENPQYSFVVPEQRFWRVFDPDDVPASMIADKNATGFFEITEATFDNLPASGKDVQGFFMPSEVTRELNKTYNVMNSADSVNNLFRALDGYLNWWKPWQTIVSPGFHSRNAVTDQLTMYTGGFGNGTGPARVLSMMENMASSWKTMFLEAMEGDSKLAQFWQRIGGDKIAGSLDDQILDYFGKPIGTRRDILKLTRNSGIYRNGWSSDLLKSVEDQYAIFKQIDTELGTGRRISMEQARGALSFLFGKRNPFIRAGAGMSNVMEGGARMAGFTDQLRKGVDVIESANWVRQNLYTSSEITHFDRAMRRFVNPFWQWKKFVIPKTVDVMLTHPEVMVAAEKAVRATYDRFPEAKFIISKSISGAERAFFSFIRKQFGVPVDRDESGIKFFLLKYWVPGTDLLELFKNPGVLLQELPPYIKTPFEQLSNHSFFFGREIATDLPGEAGTLGPLTIPEMDVPGMGKVSGARIADMLRNTMPLRVYTEPYETIMGVRGERPVDEERFSREPLAVMMRTLGLRTTFGVDPKRARQLVIEDSRRIQSQIRSQINRLRDEPKRREFYIEAYKEYVKEVKERLK
jgi:hypothetical protein